MSERKTALTNVIRIVFSNVLTLLVGVLSGFIIPKILSVDSYGYYKTFYLYISYCGLLHFGIIDGAYLYFAGKKFEDLDRKKVHSIIFFIVALQALLSVGIIIMLFATPMSFNQRIVFLLVAIYNFLLQYENIQRNILEATKCFKYESRVILLKTILTAALILTFWLMSKFIPSLDTGFYYCCLFLIIVLCLSCVLYSIKLRKFIFSKGQKIVDTKTDVLYFLRIGLPMMICNLTGTLINSIDRQFVSIYFPIEESAVFAEYSFAYSMLAFVTAATAAVTTVVYPYMKGKSSEKIISFYPKFTEIIVCFIALAFLSFFLFSGIIPLFLPKYVNSLPIFRVLLPNLALDICITVIMHNYYKFYKLENKFLIINIFTLVLTIGLDFVAYYALIKNSSAPDAIWFSAASVLCGVVWYVLSQLYLSKKIHIKHWKNDIFLFIIIVAFYLVSFTISSWLKGAFVYFAIMLVFAFAFYSNDISQLFQKVKKRIKKQK